MCDPGLYYEETDVACDYPENVNCGDRQERGRHALLEVFYMQVQTLPEHRPAGHSSAETDGLAVHDTLSRQKNFEKKHFL
jgi:hypothetical protein